MHIAAYPTRTLDDIAADFSRLADFVARDARKASREFNESYQITARRMKQFARTKQAENLTFAAVALAATGGAFATGAVVAMTAAINAAGAS